MKIRFGGYQPATTVHSRAAQLVRQCVNEQLGSGVVFELTEDITARGHKAADLLTLVESGELDLCYFSSSYLSSRVACLRLFDLPFQFADRESFYGCLSGRAGRKITEDIQSLTGYHLLGLWDNGIRHISNRVHEIRCPRDCKGLKIRTLDNALHQEVFRELGFEPHFIDVGEMRAAIANGTVDAQENPLTNIVNFKIHEFHQYVSLTAHFYGTALLLCNARWFSSLPNEVQDIVSNAADEASRKQWTYAQAEDEICLNSLKAQGIKIVQISDRDRVQFVDQVGHIVDRELDAHSDLRALTTDTPSNSLV